MDEAGIQAVKDVLDRSIKENKEYAGIIYQNPDGTFSYTKPNPGTKTPDGRLKSSPGTCPPGKKRAGDYHTHGGFDLNKPWREEFSDEDRYASGIHNQPSYLGTPERAIKKWEPRLTPNLPDWYTGGETKILVPPKRP